MWRKSDQIHINWGKQKPVPEDVSKIKAYHHEGNLPDGNTLMDVIDFCVRITRTRVKIHNMADLIDRHVVFMPERALTYIVSQALGKGYVVNPSNSFILLGYEYQLQLIGGNDILFSAILKSEVNDGRSTAEAAIFSIKLAPYLHALIQDVNFKEQST